MPGPDVEAAVVGLVVPGEDAHQRRLARAVGPDQADPLAGADLELQAVEDRVARELPAQVIGGDEDHEDLFEDRARVGARSCPDQACAAVGSGRGS